MAYVDRVTVIWRGRKHATCVQANKKQVDRYPQVVAASCRRARKAIATRARGCCSNGNEGIWWLREKTSLVLPLARSRALRSGAASSGRSRLRGDDGAHPKQLVRRERRGCREIVMNRKICARLDVPVRYKLGLGFMSWAGLRCETVRSGLGGRTRGPEARQGHYLRLGLDPRSPQISPLRLFLHLSIYRASALPRLVRPKTLAEERIVFHSFEKATSGTSDQRR